MTEFEQILLNNIKDEEERLALKLGKIEYKIFKNISEIKRKLKIKELEEMDISSAMYFKTVRKLKDLNYIINENNSDLKINLKKEIYPKIIKHRERRKLEIDICIEKTQRKLEELKLQRTVINNMTMNYNNNLKNHNNLIM